MAGFSLMRIIHITYSIGVGPPGRCEVAGHTRDRPRAKDGRGPARVDRIAYGRGWRALGTPKRFGFPGRHGGVGVWWAATKASPSPPAGQPRGRGPLDLCQKALNRFWMPIYGSGETQSGLRSQWTLQPAKLSGTPAVASEIPSQELGGLPEGCGSGILEAVR